nr:immunoglobulin heavy chain junction region [Mus musculus]
CARGGYGSISWFAYW